ncbi:MAG: hypothetical protein ACE5I3_03290 [Phycisphaerae bacterium]
MAVIKMKRFTTELRNAYDPVTLGQTRGGVVLAAVLVACWQLSAPARAQVPPNGYSINDYSLLEWHYSLDDGTGTIRLRNWDDWPSHDLILEQARFTTAGVTFDSILDGHGNELFGPPTYVGDENGRPLFEYDLLDPITLEGLNDPLEIEVTYPGQGVELRATGFGYEGRLSAVFGPILPIPPASMPFVTIQTIPEPPVLATLGLGTAALVTAQRRRRREDSHLGS